MESFLEPVMGLFGDLVLGTSSGAPPGAILASFGPPLGDFRPFLDGFGSHFAQNFNDIWKHVSTDLIVFLFVLRDAS